MEFILGSRCAEFLVSCSARLLPGVFVHVSGQDVACLEWALCRVCLQVFVCTAGRACGRILIFSFDSFEACVMRACAL